MGTYLSTPVTEKCREEGHVLSCPSTPVAWGVVDMQGWRKGMEDAHIAQMVATTPQHLLLLTTTTTTKTATKTNTTQQTTQPTQPAVPPPLIHPLQPQHQQQPEQTVSAAAGAATQSDGPAVAISVSNSVPTKVFAVFDGHGGPEVARFCQLYFVSVLTQQESWRHAQQPPELPSPSNHSHPTRPSETDIGIALRATFHALDRMIDDPQRRDELMRLRALKPAMGEYREANNIPLPRPNDKAIQQQQQNYTYNNNNQVDKDDELPFDEQPNAFQSFKNNNNNNNNEEDTTIITTTIANTNQHDNKQEEESNKQEEVEQETTAKMALLLQQQPQSSSSSEECQENKEHNNNKDHDEKDTNGQVEEEEQEEDFPPTEKKDDDSDMVVLGKEEEEAFRIDYGSDDYNNDDDSSLETIDSKNNEDDTPSTVHRQPETNGRSNNIIHHHRNNNNNTEDESGVEADTEEEAEAAGGATAARKVSAMFQRLLKMSAATAERSQKPQGQLVVALSPPPTTTTTPTSSSSSVVNNNNGVVLSSDQFHLHGPPTAKTTTAPASLISNGRVICNLPDHVVHAGATAVCAVLIGTQLTVANAGDSRAVLSRNGAAFPLSFDHKPNHETELSRIQQAGGFVNQYGRVNGNLNLSRSIGDLKYKQVHGLTPAQQMITAEPDIIQIHIDPRDNNHCDDDNNHDNNNESSNNSNSNYDLLHANDEFIILACDGIWDCLTNQQAVDFVRHRIHHSKPTDIGTEMLDHIISIDPRTTQGIGGDNMTVLIVDLQPEKRAYYSSSSLGLSSPTTATTPEGGVPSSSSNNNNNKQYANSIDTAV